MEKPTETTNLTTETGRLSLEDFKKSFIQKEDEQELENLTGGILGSCHSFMDTLKDIIDSIDDAARNLGK